MKRAAGIIFRTMILLLIGVGLGLLISNNFSSRSLGFSLVENEKISHVLSLLKHNYVDSVNTDSLEGIAVNNLLQNLDPHSLYLPPQQAQSINERLEGTFNGLGFQYQLLRDTLFVTQIYPGSPAAMAGLKTGDRIINVNNDKFSGTHLTSNRINKIFKGGKDPQLILYVSITGSKILKPYIVKRGNVELSSLDADYMLNKDIGYIKISKFALTTDADFRSALTRLRSQGLQKLVLDLRDNGGGYLNAATALADEFLPKGRLIVYTKGDHEQRKDYFATDSGIFQDGKVAVLIDEYSASASEILSGALQDLDRAVIVGRRSYGKGLVQQQFPFSDGSAVNLTVARYYTPSGRSIQKSYRSGIDAYHNEIAERMRRGELFSEQNSKDDSIFSKPSPYRTMKGRKVYSGGGIMPDIFVPADTTYNTMLIRQLTGSQVFTAFVIDKMQSLLKRYPSADAFEKQYIVNADEYQSFIIYASNTIREIDSQDLVTSGKSIRQLIKAYAARFQWGENAYYRALNADDMTISKAVDAIN